MSDDFVPVGVLVVVLAMVKTHPGIDVDTLAAHLGMNKRVIRRAIKLLHEQGQLVMEQRVF